MKSAVSFTMSEVVANFIWFIKPQTLDEEGWSSEESSEDENDTAADVS